jgi:hypothetical protein
MEDVEPPGRRRTPNYEIILFGVLRRPGGFLHLRWRLAAPARAALDGLA